MTARAKPVEVGGEIRCEHCRRPMEARVGRSIGSPRRWLWWECTGCQRCTPALPVPFRRPD